MLPYLVGRPLPATEVYEAFGYRKSAYYKAAHEGRLITADNLLRVAEHFDLNALDLLVRYALISPETVAAYVDSQPTKTSLPRLSELHPIPSHPPL